jgi:hypothetical protein
VFVCLFVVSNVCVFCFSLFLIDPGFRQQNWRLKLLLSLSSFVIGFAVYGDEQALHSARNPPWIQQRIRKRDEE